MYLRNVEVLMGYFARRCGDPHTVADLTSETFACALAGRNWSAYIARQTREPSRANEPGRG